VSHEAAETCGHVIRENVSVRIVTLVLTAEGNGSGIEEVCEPLPPD
jgi:hypothetical protein